MVCKWEIGAQIGIRGHKAALCEGLKYGPCVWNRKGGVLVQTHMYVQTDPQLPLLAHAD